MFGVYDIKLRLMKLNLTQVWLVQQLEKRYGVTVDPAHLSRFINGVSKTPKAQRVLSLCNEILKEKEAERVAEGERNVQG